MADELGPTPQQLGRHLEELRQTAGLTIEQLAERAGLPVGRVALIESGEIDPGLEELTHYARALGLSMAKVFHSWERKLN